MIYGELCMYRRPIYRYRCFYGYFKNMHSVCEIYFIPQNDQMFQSTFQTRTINYIKTPSSRIVLLSTTICFDYRLTLRPPLFFFASQFSSFNCTMTRTSDSMIRSWTTCQFVLLSLYFQLVFARC